MRMEEWADLGHLSYSPAPQLWTGAPPPLCFRVLFGKVQQCCISRNKTTGDFKFHHLQTGVSHLCPPSPFLTAEHEKVVFVCVFLRALLASSGGGGGHVPLRPPHWVRHWRKKSFISTFYTDAVCLAIVLAVVLMASDLDLDKCSDVRMRENYVTKGIPKTSFLSFFLSILSRSNFDHHLRCGGWLNFEFS